MTAAAWSINACFVYWRIRMPEVIVHAVSGRSAEQKKALMSAITQAVVDNFGVGAEHVVVQIVESAPDSKSKGGIPFSER
jgi:4-oxalocrotonate tautomerase